MRKFLLSSAVAAIATMAAAAPANAVITIGGNIGGYGTFVDSNTGRSWVRMNTFFNQSHNQMATAVASAGFTVANRSDVEGLLNSLSLTPASNWTSYSTIMGSAPNRALIWGSYGPVNQSGNVGWAYSFQGDSGWSFVDAATSANVPPNANNNFADMNIWAYTAGIGVVPEPGTWAMMILGFGVIGGALRSARRRPRVNAAFRAA